MPPLARTDVFRFHPMPISIEVRPVWLTEARNVTSSPTRTGSLNTTGRPTASRHTAESNGTRIRRRRDPGD